MTTLSALNIYPIKACRGQTCERTFVERRGLEHDRRFLIVDSEGLAITQRDDPALALVVPHLMGDCLSLVAPDMPELSLPLIADGPVRRVTVWDDNDIKAIDQGDRAAEWFLTYLKTAGRALSRPYETIRLVYMTRDSLRPVNPKYAKSPDDHVSFADGYPILIASQESLDDLNRRLDAALPMNRFRPNLVVAGCSPFEEDTWKRIRIGEIEIALVKPCARCEVTTIDQISAKRGKEPLKTLATFRRVDGGKVMFGMNAIPYNEGRLRVGDQVEVLA